jgi:hypothetical protein
MLELLDALIDLFSWLFAWRFLLCVGTGVVLVTSLHFLLSRGPLLTGLSVGIGIATVVAGVIWESRSR